MENLETKTIQEIKDICKQYNIGHIGDKKTLIKKIKYAYKKHKPDLPFAITSDIIVGFPGETKKQFLESATMMQRAKYDMVFFGQYSPRPSTAA